MSSEGLHAPRDRLSQNTLAHHQAVTSLIEELEAADWYRQRADDCDEEALKAILLHNMREEIEHACMILEWLRRNFPEWSGQLDEYLYSEGSITAAEEAATGKAPGEDAPEPRSGAGHRPTIGSLKEPGK